MKHKLSVRVLGLLMGSAMIFGALTACGGSGDSGNTSGDPSGSDKPADSGKVYELSLSMHDPATTPIAQYYQRWADKVLEETDGKVKITLYCSSTLAAAGDVEDMVVGGGVDMGWVYTSFYPNQYPLTDVVTAVRAGFEGCVTTTEAMWDLYDEYQELRDEWGDYKLLNLYANPAALICTKDAPVTTLADMSGRSLRCPAGMIATVTGAWGANPISMPPGDAYQALEKNNISGVIFEVAGVVNFTLQEQLKYYSEMPLYQGAFSLIMNQSKWDSLPTEYQTIIENAAGRTGSLEAASVFDQAAIDSTQTIKDAGGEFVSLSAEALAEFQPAADKVTGDWAAQNSANGFDGQAYLNRAKELVAEYQSK